MVGILSRLREDFDAPPAIGRNCILRGEKIGIDANGSNRRLRRNAACILESIDSDNGLSGRPAGAGRQHLQFALEIVGIVRQRFKILCRKFGRSGPMVGIQTDCAGVRSLNLGLDAGDAQTDGLVDPRRTGRYPFFLLILGKAGSLGLQAIASVGEAAKGIAPLVVGVRLGGGRTFERNRCIHNQGAAGVAHRSANLSRPLRVACLRGSRGGPQPETHAQQSKNLFVLHSTIRMALREEPWQWTLSAFACDSRHVRLGQQRPFDRYKCGCPRFAKLTWGTCIRSKFESLLVW